MTHEQKQRAMLVRMFIQDEMSFAFGYWLTPVGDISARFIGVALH